MREAMKVDGWLSSRLLPEGWMFKEQGKNNDRKPPQLLTSEGAHFKSFRNAIEYMRASYTYNEEDIKGLEFLVEELSGARRTQSEEWLETEGLPGGWKNKVTKVDICGLSLTDEIYGIFLTNAISENDQKLEEKNRNFRTSGRRFDEVETSPRRPARSFLTQNLT